MALKITVRNKVEIQNADGELRHYLKALLTLLNPEWVEAQTFGRYTGNIPKELYQFSETKSGSLIIPKGLLEHLLNDLGRDYELIDERVTPESEKVWPEGNVILRPGDQEPAVQELLSHDSGFLSAPAGSGKTVMGLEACRRLGLKALWLTHRQELKAQVIEEIEDHLEIPEDQIGIIHGKKWKIGEQITVGMIPTLNKRDLTPLVNEFGVVMVDEAHHVPSNTFLNVVESFNSRYLYGLTATAYRRDKLEAVMFNAMGPVTSRIDHFDLFEGEELMKPTIRRRDTGWYPTDAATMDYHAFMEEMVSAAGRNQLIVNDVVRECQPGNYCIILVERTKHAEVLTDLLKSRGVKCEYVVGSIDVDGGPRKKGEKRKKKAIPMKVREKIVADFKGGRLQVLATTYDLLKEGFNFKPLNRLFLATPIKWKGSVVQALGRIQRPAEGKPNAIAYDYVDNQIGMFANQADIRLFRVYKKMGMPVEKV